MSQTALDAAPQLTKEHLGIAVVVVLFAALIVLPLRLFHDPTAPAAVIGPEAADTVAPSQVLRDAATAFAGATSAQITGTMPDANGEPMRVLLRLTAAGGTATLHTHDGNLDAVRIGPRFYLRGNPAAVRDAADVTLPTSANAHTWRAMRLDAGGKLAALLSLPASSRTLLPTTVTQRSISNRDGLPVIKLASPGGALYVRSDGSPLPVVLEAPDTNLAFVYNVPLSLRPLASFSARAAAEDAFRNRR
jgi:hypothetical protein